MFSSFRFSVRIASTLALLSTFTTWAGAQEAGTSVPTAPPTQSPSALAAPGTTPDIAPTATLVGSSDEPVIDASTTRKTLPNTPLLVTGFVLLGGTYGASAIVGAVSNRDADKKLYYPVAGPWLDLNHRGCNVNPCSNNTLDRVLLVGDGIVQGIGALGMLLSLVVPEKTTHDWYLIGNSRVVVAPQFASSMLGLSAAGQF